MWRFPQSESESARACYREESYREDYREESYREESYREESYRGRCSIERRELYKRRARYPIEDSAEGSPSEEAAALDRTFP